MRIEDYLDQHTIICIGAPLPGYICCEVIVDNPRELIDIIKGCGCFISEIRFWDRAEIAKGSNVGYGGPRDPQSPDTHFFAETDICRTFDSLSQNDDYLKYIDQINIMHSWPEHDLFPAFDIRWNTEVEEQRAQGTKSTGDGSVC